MLLLLPHFPGSANPPNRETIAAALLAQEPIPSLCELGPGVLPIMADLYRISDFQQTKYPPDRWITGVLPTRHGISPNVRLKTERLSS